MNYADMAVLTIGVVVLDILVFALTLRKTMILRRNSPSNLWTVFMRDGKVISYGYIVALMKLNLPGHQAPYTLGASVHVAYDIRRHLTCIRIITVANLTNMLTFAVCTRSSYA